MKTHGGLVKKILYLFLCVFVVSGCAKIKHLDQLLLIKGMSDEQADIDDFVESQTVGFNNLLNSIQQGSFDEYKTKDQIYQAFGEPIIKEKVEMDQQEFEVWLYRKPVGYFKSKKVYIYFDQAGLVSDWRHHKIDVECLSDSLTSENDMIPVMMCPLEGHLIQGAK